MVEIAKKYENTLIVTTKSAVSGLEKVIKAMNGKNIDIVTYGKLKSINKKYDLICIDEAHSNISSFPKMSKARTELGKLIHKDVSIVWSSGSPSIESSAQLYHQLSLSPRHSFSKYKSFHEWFYPKGHYADKNKGGGYGIDGVFKYTGATRPIQDYSVVKDFSDKFDPIMIRRSEEEANVQIHIKHITPPDNVHLMISHINSVSISVSEYGTIIANNGASKISKTHQLSGGTAITEEHGAIVVDHFKAKAVHKQHKDTNTCVFYKYIAEKELLSEYFNEEDLYQVDSNCTGLDLSHYDDMAIFSLTWSGSNYVQVLNRLVNVNRQDIPNVYIYITKYGPDKKIYDSVSNKRNVNAKMLGA